MHSVLHANTLELEQQPQRKKTFIIIASFSPHDDMDDDGDGDETDRSYSRFLVLLLRLSVRVSIESIIRDGQVNQ